MVPITMDLEGREGADVVLISRSIVPVEESWESLSWSWSWFVILGSLMSSLREVLRRFFAGVTVAVAVAGERHGRSRRRASILVIGLEQRIKSKGSRDCWVDVVQGKAGNRYSR